MTGNRPCDQAGENCPLQGALASGNRERVLHIHQTPRGREHVDVELLPLHDAKGKLKYFVELLKPVTVASPEVDRSNLVGNSAAFNVMLGKLMRVAPTDAAVLLLGESGSGKELAAQAIHAASRRQHKALVTLECAGLTETLFESELFGHVKGAFTGANTNKTGLAEAADGGTLFLDELPSLAQSLQAKLLTVLEDHSLRRVGATRPIAVDSRIIAATNADLGVLVTAGKFREDLLHRLDLFRVRLPPLRERGNDILVLADALLARVCKRYGQKPPVIPPEGQSRLLAHAWPGNVRELAHELERAVVFGGERGLNFGHLGGTQATGSAEYTAWMRPGFVFPESGFSLEAVIDRIVAQAVQQAEGNVSAAARLLGVSRDVVRYRIKGGGNAGKVGE